MATINTDLYNIRGVVEDIKKQYIPEAEDTLNLGIFGYLGDIEAKKIQTAVMMVGELENEVFPSRAKLDKNIITHAIMQNITDINATPANMTIILGISVSDLDKHMVNGKFVFDKNFKIVFENENTEDSFEFHFDYDIVLTRSTRNNKPVYAAVYDISEKNPISTIANPYLKQPYTIRMNNNEYVFLQCTVRQVKMVTKYNQIVNSNVIDNKTFTFEFEDQLATFDIVAKQNGIEYKLTPIFEGAGVPDDAEYFCYYTYINSNIIRVKFERTSFMPDLNAEIEVRIMTTKGSSATFNYTEDMYMNLISEKYKYDNIMVFIRPNTSSRGGIDRKSTAELQKIIPKEMISRGSITMDEDLQNYFNLINNDDVRLKVIKKVDNQIERIYYSYFLMRNSIGNIVPTNTIDIDIRDLDFSIYEENGTCVLPAGTMIEYDPTTFIGKVVKESTSEYVYSTLYSILINVNPLYCSSYLSVINENPYLTFEYINQDTDLQFIADRVNFKRYLLHDKDTYFLQFSANQNINTRIYPDELDEDPDKILEYLKDKIKAVIVLYKDGCPYRYAFGDISAYDEETYKYTFDFTFVTDNRFDLNNNIKILDLGIAGFTENAYGYMNDSTESRIYILSKFDKAYGRHDLDGIIPGGLEEYSVTNIFEIYGGLTFYVNYSSLMNTTIKITENHDECERYMYKVLSIPVVGYEYISDEDKVFDLVDELNYRKYYMDNALNVLENSFEIDFKFFNTYGISRTYSVDELGNTTIGRLDITSKFKLSLKSSADEYTKNTIIQDIKDYVEDLDELDDLHIPNLVSYITNKYNSALNYFGWRGFNTFDANTQHMYKHETEDKTICPEFINIRNTVDIDGNIVPMIEIETVVG